MAPNRCPGGSIDFRRLADQLKLASNATRLNVLLLLGSGERRFDVLGLETWCSRRTLSSHLARLRLAGLVGFLSGGPRHTYVLTAKGRALLRIVEAQAGERDAEAPAAHPEE